MKRMLLLLVLSALAGSCQRPIRCNVNGEIIIPQDASAGDKSAWSAANTNLENRRTQATFGGSTAYTTRASLEKAEGCP